MPRSKILAAHPRSHFGIEPLFLGMLLFIPFSVLLAFFGANDAAVFLTAILGIVPLARILGFATRELAIQTNPTISGVLNATFGNIIELIIAVLALSRGLVVLVQASIIGSIIGNLLLLLGLSLFVGGIRYKEQRFNKEAAGVSATMLIIAVVGLAIPTVYALTLHPSAARIALVSDTVAIVLALTYLASLFFAFKTHRHLFDSSDEMRLARERPTISKRMAALIIGVATVFVALESELLVRTVGHAASAIGFTETFVGVVVIAVITNIAEKANALHFALENKMDVALAIGLSSAIQIALFVVPILVFISHAFGFGFSLVFTFFEMLAVLLTVMIVNYLSSDGRCNWLEGVQLLSVYLIIAAVFFFV